MSTHFVENLRVVSTVAGIGLVFAGERYFVGAPSHMWLVAVGISLMVAGIAFAIKSLLDARARGHNRELPSWRLAICWQSQILGASGLYFLYFKLLGSRPFPDTFAMKALLASWVLMAVFGFFMGFGIEWAQLNNGRAEMAEPQRVRLTARSALKVAMLFVIIASLNYMAVKKNVTWDLSYLKTTRPSESTAKVISSLEQDVSVALFFPLGNEVLSHVHLYFSGISALSPHLSVNTFDVEINPLSAEEFKVNRNGYVVLKSGSNTERFDLGLTMSTAKKTLKNIDIEFQKALLATTQKRKVVYFTRGHGELTWNGADEGLGLKSIKLIEKYLRTLNYTVKFFGVSEGSTKEVPADADAVVVAGGDLPFLIAEAEVLQKYVEGHGKLMLLLDVDVPLGTTMSPNVRDATHDPLVKWLSTIGLTFEPKMLANMTNHYAGTKSAADVWFLYTTVFTSHESVQTLARNDQKGAAILTLRSGYFTTKQDVPEWSVNDTVRSLSDTFVDENRNFKYDEGKEVRGPKVLGAVAEQKVSTKPDPKSGAQPSPLPGAKPDETPPGRVVAFADASIISDPLIQNQGNLVYFVDSLRWLVGGTLVTGVPVSEEDIRIRHTSKEDAAWFYGTIVLVPGLVLLAGALATRRSRRPRIGGAV